MTVKELASRAGMSQRAIARRFGIPYRTMEEWSRLNRCPEYILRMMDEILMKETRIRETKEMAFDHDGRHATGREVAEWVYPTNGGAPVLCWFAEYEGDDTVSLPTTE